MSQQKTAQSFGRSRLIVETRLKKRQAVVDEVVADMFFGACFLCLVREIDCGLCDLEFAGARTFADALDYVSIAIA